MLLNLSKFFIFLHFLFFKFFYLKKLYFKTFDVFFII
ncbi:hypothetical protein CoNPh17_CDS0132 [Staphylococcus phage S-CoN_Ph17]|nr:hypothetical protein CoNPh17_CDS0132 [Staphylococcus phage S-CoN_Ph17]